MTDNELIKIFLPIIQDGLIADGFDDIAVIQGNQPTQQGVNISPSVYFYKIGDKRYGYTGRYTEWDSDTEKEIRTEVQLIETMYQVTALVLQDVNNTNSYTASDLANEIAAILQSEDTVTKLNAQEIGILRISDIRNLYSWDDRDQFEGFPSFDFTLTHKQNRITVIPVVQSTELDIYRV